MEDFIELLESNRRRWSEDLAKRDLELSRTTCKLLDRFNNHFEVHLQAPSLMFVRTAESFRSESKDGESATVRAEALLGLMQVIASRHWRESTCPGQEYRRVVRG